MNYFDAFNVLGLKAPFTQNNLKRAYREMALKYHPDKYADKPAEIGLAMKEKFQQINAAFNFLSNSTNATNCVFSDSAAKQQQNKVF